MREGDQPPDDRKGQPGEEEAEGEREQRPAPLRVNEGGEDVLEKPQSPTVQLGLHNVAVAILEDRPLAEAFRGSRAEVPASC